MALLDIDCSQSDQVTEGYAKWSLSHSKLKSKFINLGVHGISILHTSPKVKRTKSFKFVYKDMMSNL